MEAVAKLAEEAMGCVLSVLDLEMYDAVQRDRPEKKLGRAARAVRILTYSMMRHRRKNSRHQVVPICCVAGSVWKSLLLLHCR